MSHPTISVLVYFGTVATGGNVFTLDDPTKGVLDNVTYTLGGDTGTEVSSYVRSLSFDRGKPELVFDDISAGIARVVFDNRDRRFDPFHASGPYYGNLKPGKRVTIAANGITVFDGRVQDWQLDYEVSGNSTATMIVEDALATLARKQFNDWTTTASQTAGQRLTDVLNRPEVAWPGGQRSLSTGISVLQGDTVTWGSNVLNYCQLVARSDGPSAFFASRTGVLTFKDRQSNLNAAAVATFNDQGTGIPFTDVQHKSGADTFYTRVSVDRAGGTAQTYTTSTSQSDDVISLSISNTLQNSDAQALDMASYYANVYATGEARVSGVGVVLATEIGVTTDYQATILRLELNDVVSVSWTPNGVGSAITQKAVIIGISHRITPAMHEVQLSLGKFDNRAFFILDDPVYGVLDAGNVLAF